MSPSGGAHTECALDITTQCLLEAVEVGLVRLDAQGAIIWMNSAAAAMLGTSCDTLLGRAMASLIVPAHREAEASSTGAAALQETRATVQLQRGVQAVFRRDDGSSFPVEYTCSPLPDVQCGQGAVLTFSDVSHRVATEDMLRHFKRAVEQSPSTIVITDARGQIEYVNPKLTEISGYTLEEVRGQNPRLFKSGETPPEEYAELWRTITGGGEWRGEFHNRKKNGELYWEAASISALRNTQGAITHFLAVKEDITARKQAEEERARAFAAVRDLQEQQRLVLQTISHDLRAPLTVILGHARVLQEMVGAEDPGQQSVDAILRGAQRMNTMIQELVEAARLDGGQLHLHRRPIALAPYLANLLLGLAPDERHRIHLELSAALPAVDADADRLERILLNLLSNALKYSPADAPVYIRATAGDGEVVLAVSDQGSGIAPDDLPHLFERFYRAASERTVEGVGLGLYIARKLAEAHGGRLWVASTRGQGSTFSLALPESAPVPQTCANEP
jgi:PAS domain S-box-containing protein